MSRIKYTDKQLEVLKIIKNKNIDNSNVTLDDILSKLSYNSTKESLQFIVRNLVNHDLIEKLDLKMIGERVRRTFKITVKGLSVLTMKRM